MADSLPLPPRSPSPSGKTAGGVRFDAVAVSSSHAQTDQLDQRLGTLRVWVLEAKGLQRRAAATPSQPYATVALNELTRRRVRRTRAAPAGPSPSWREAFDFGQASLNGQVVVDLWDSPDSSAPAELLGKAVVSVSECRLGVPHTMIKHMLQGQLVRMLISSLLAPQAIRMKIRMYLD
eukprot:scaffold241832_cov29-Tisochrysis_lutea.AAC.5